jgi:hypothetical protein
VPFANFLQHVHPHRGILTGVSAVQINILIVATKAQLMLVRRKLDGRNILFDGF